MTLNALALHSEPYGSTGNIGENFRRLLGAPSLDPLQTLIREAVQNIADAAKPDHGPEILIRLRTLSHKQREVLRSVVLRDIPQEGTSREALQSMFGRQALIVLEICDFQTIGLGGPTRSDRIPVGTKRTDFIDFLRNIGSPRNTEHAGGTYGFGKVALYRASRCSTILVDTLPHDGGADDRRLIGCHVGRSFDIPDNGMLRRFTGRHWWGVADPEDGVADPVTGNDAVQMAAALGFPDRGRDGSGTSIMIVDFEAEGEDLRATGLRVAEALLWNFWPRMMRDVPPNRRFVCRVEAEGAQIPIPAPEDHAPFELFCKAMRAARKGSGNNVQPIASLRPERFLGTLAVEKGLRSPRRPLVESSSVVPRLLHHIALMRPVELVVKYLIGSPLPDERLEWAGVFLVSEEQEVESAFADAEPPAHDDWIPDNLPRSNAKRYVNIALRKLRYVGAEMGVGALGPPPAGHTSTRPLAHLAGKLGAVLDDVGGYRPGPRPVSRPPRARASRPVFERLELDKAGRIAIFTTEVTQDKNRGGATLTVSAAIAIDGAGARRIEDAIAQPTVLGIRSADNETVARGPLLALEGREGRFELRVLVPIDCAVTVDAEVLPESAE